MADKRNVYACESLWCNALCQDVPVKRCIIYGRCQKHVVILSPITSKMQCNSWVDSLEYLMGKATVYVFLSKTSTTANNCNGRRPQLMEEFDKSLPCHSIRCESWQHAVIVCFKPKGWLALGVNSLECLIEKDYITCLHVISTACSNSLMVAWSERQKSKDTCHCPFGH